VQLAVQIVNQVSPQVDTRASELRALVDSGVSVSQAARQVGVSRSTAHKKLKGV
jgi:transcriptional regulator of acetoin/glycerol metabolism